MRKPLELPVKMQECPECEEGQCYEDTSRSCLKPMNECCGGCGYNYTCQRCNGTGEIEIEDEE
jgi:hypothetical protein